jgi:predicted Zn-dependent protease
METTNHTDFEAFLNNEMTTQAKIEFENKLINDLDFKADFDLYKETTIHFQNHFSNERALFQENLNQIAQSTQTQKPKTISFKPWYFAVAASVATFIGVFVFQNQQKADYTDFNSHPTAYFSERGDVIQDLKLAENAFNKKDYKTASKNFALVLKSYPQPEVKYFYAISLLESDQISKAQTIFEELKSVEIYRNTSIWYLALAELKQKNNDKCKAILKTIPNDFEDYDKVETLLKKL